MNIALLSKLTWMMSNNGNSLWVRSLKAKYLKGNSIFEVKKKNSNSFGWKSILEGTKPILKGARFKLGNGSGINPLSDPWIPTMENGTPKLKDGVTPSGLRRVFELKNMESQDWNHQLVRELFDNASAEAILQIDWPIPSCEDVLLWKGNDRGEFTVKESFLQLFDNHVDDKEWEDLWKLRFTKDSEFLPGG